ncbi:M48 family metallopeptidase [Sediminibacterium sp.]|uniref:M48 family metallopeptidase n=1 Tax=Sediminibacterium sp. TaxID=1917865 RepID=UPI0027334E28|nr:M48 family metallopeptidase [Sediminibacterium sp.]MDP3393680.1 M48 family metallopeptidase [Sediminibacterium sp.]MDP3566547.1 M48 family metallopeptidase [Sediminibacterium sp.]
MKKIIQSVTFVAIIVVAIACQRNAITGRKQLTLVPESEAQSLAVSQYRSFLNTNKVVSGTAEAVMVKRVGDRIVTAIKKYYQQKGLSNELEGYTWDINLVSDKQMNAWCMPGGKIVVYTGILPVTQNEAGLAVVMGHEIAHALARHGSERMSQGLLQQGLGAGMSIALSNKPQLTQDIFNASYGIASGTVMPAFSRSNELEADRFGLMFSALAGFDPREALSFWKRMSAVAGGGNTNSILSTHPSDAERMAALEKIMASTIQNYYKKS